MRATRSGDRVAASKPWGVLGLVGLLVGGGLAGLSASAEEEAPRPRLQRLPAGRPAVIRGRAARIVLENSGADPATPEGGVLILAERREVQRLRVATEMVEKGDYANAVDLLQRVLGTPEESPLDGFFLPDPNDRNVFRSMKTESLRLIGGLPAEGAEVYERQYGPVARTLLDEAVRDGDMGRVGDVARLFLHTQAGAEAAYRLGQHSLDQGQPLAAALWFDRLRKRPDAARTMEPALSLQSAMSWGRAGVPETAGAILAELKDAARALTAGGEAVELFRTEDGPRNWLARHTADSVRASDRLAWPLYRNLASRNAVTLATADAGDATWRCETSVDVAKDPTAPSEDGKSELDRLLSSATRAMAEGMRQSRSATALPKRHPVVVNGRVVARSLSHTYILDLNSGERVQETFPEQGGWTLMDRFHRETAWPNGEQQLKGLVQQRIWEDATFGTMSTDGELVFCVEETGIGSSMADQQLFQEVGPKGYNRLAGYDIDTGKLELELGGPAGGGNGPLGGRFKLPLEGACFLGVPLPLGGQLYCLVEIDNEVRLVVLHVNSEQQADGRKRWTAVPVWQQPVASVPALLSAASDARRRQAGMSVSYSDGIAVCPTEIGAVVAVDVTTRTLLWAHRVDHPGMGAMMQPFPGRPMFQQPGGLPTGGDPLATIADGRVLLMPAFSNKLTCLDLHDGSLAWERERDDTLYIGGVVDGKVLLVADDEVQAVSLKDGQPLWKEPTDIARPSGQGFIAGDRLYVPLSSAKIAVINVETGELLTHVATPDNIIPGNLVLHRGLFISQGAEAVDVFPAPQVGGDARKTVAAAP